MMRGIELYGMDELNARTGPPDFLLDWILLCLCHNEKGTTNFRSAETEVTIPNSQRFSKLSFKILLLPSWLQTTGSVITEITPAVLAISSTWTWYLPAAFCTPLIFIIFTVLEGGSAFFAVIAVLTPHTARITACNKGKLANPPKMDQMTHEHAFF